MARIFLAILAVAVTLALPLVQCCAAEPVVEETREGGNSVIHIKATDGGEQIYRSDLSQRHSPATERNDLLKKWESYRFGAFVCFNSNQFSGQEHCKATDPKLYKAVSNLKCNRGSKNEPRKRMALLTAG